MDTVTLWSDIGCPWAHVAVARLHRHRLELGLTDRFRIDHRAFPLELINERATPKRTLDAEVPVVRTLEPAARWQAWRRPAFEWPVTTLPALEAVQAVKLTQGLAASETFDRALRVAFFGQSRCISLVPVIVEVARECEGLDAADVEESLHRGVGRPAVVEQWQQATAEASPVRGSPHLFMPSGDNAHNPGISMRWEGEDPGVPVIDSDDPAVYEKLLACFKRAV